MIPTRGLDFRREATRIRRTQNPHCEFTFTPDLTTRPLLNDVYKGYRQTSRRNCGIPHMGLVFDRSCGVRVRFAGANFAPQFFQKDDTLSSIAKRTFARNASAVDEENGIYVMLSGNAIRETVLKHSTRRAFTRYWGNFDQESTPPAPLACVWRFSETWWRYIIRSAQRFSKNRSSYAPI